MGSLENVLEDRKNLSNLSKIRRYLIAGGFLVIVGLAGILHESAIQELFSNETQNEGENNTDWSREYLFGNLNTDTVINEESFEHQQDYIDERPVFLDPTEGHLYVDIHHKIIRIKNLFISNVGEDKSLHVFTNAQNNLDKYDLPFSVNLGIGYKAPIVVFDIWTFNHQNGDAIFYEKMEKFLQQLQQQPPLEVAEDSVKNIFRIYIHFFNDKRVHLESSFHPGKYIIFAPLWENLFRAFYIAAGGVASCIQSFHKNFLDRDDISVESYLQEYHWILYHDSEKKNHQYSYKFGHIYEKISRFDLMYFSRLHPGIYEDVTIGISSFIKIKEITSEVVHSDSLQLIGSTLPENVLAIKRKILKSFSPACALRAASFSCVRDFIFRFTLSSEKRWSGFEESSLLRKNYVSLLNSISFPTTFSLSSSTTDCVSTGVPVKVLLVVRKCGTRTLQNINDLIDSFLKLTVQISLTIISFEDPTFLLEDQIRFVNQCDILVTAHGAAMTHSFFLKPGALVIEIFPNGFCKTIYKNILKIIGPVQRTDMAALANAESGIESLFPSDDFYDDGFIYGTNYLAQYTTSPRLYLSLNEIEWPLNWNCFNSKNTFRNQQIYADIATICNVIQLKSNLSGGLTCHGLQDGDFEDKKLESIPQTTMDSHKLPFEEQLFHSSISFSLFGGRNENKKWTTTTAKLFDERFLLYTPWEQLNNQLVGFISACALAATLNRTLVLPPIGHRSIQTTSRQLYRPSEFIWYSMNNYFDMDALKTKLPCRIVEFKYFEFWLKLGAFQLLKKTTGRHSRDSRKSKKRDSSKGDPSKTTDHCIFKKDKKKIFSGHFTMALCKYCTLASADDSLNEGTSNNPITIFCQMMGFLIGPLHYHPLNGSKNVIPNQLFEYYEAILNLPHQGIVSHMTLHDHVGVEKIQETFKGREEEPVLALGMMFQFFLFTKPKMENVDKFKDPNILAEDLELRIPYPVTQYIDLLKSPLYHTIREAIRPRSEIKRLAALWIERLIVYYSKSSSTPKIFNAVHLRRGDYQQKCTQERSYIKSRKTKGFQQPLPSFHACWQSNEFLLQKLIQLSPLKSDVWYVSTNEHKSISKLQETMAENGFTIVTFDHIIDLQRTRKYQYCNNIKDELFLDINLLFSLLASIEAESYANTSEKMPSEGGKIHFEGGKMHSKNWQLETTPTLPQHTFNLFKKLINSLNPIHVALLEQEICSLASLFVGNMYSSYTRRIVEDRQLFLKKESFFF